MSRRFRSSRPLGVILVLAVAGGLTGCSLVALPIRAASDVVKAVPVAGPIAAAPLDVAADTID